MSAAEITDAVINSLKNNPADFYLINYANADMVGHSGDFKATIEAIKFLDEQLGKLYDVIVNQLDGTMYITGDHGNAEYMYDEVTGQPRTSHTTNPVYFLMISNDAHPTVRGACPAKPWRRREEEACGEPGRTISNHIKNLHSLSDIAPFILENMGLEVPKVMLKNDDSNL